MDLEARLAQLGGVKPIRGNKFILMREEEIERLERKLGILLPKPYRELLTTYGASTFGDLVQFRPIQNLPAELSSTGKGFFAYFYGGARDAHDDDSYSLERCIRVFSGRMPETLIPIGGDGGGNQICLGTRGTEAGKVYYWDHHDEWDEEDYLEDYGQPMPPEMRFQNVYPIAESFEDFLNRLEVYRERPVQEP